MIRTIIISYTEQGGQLNDRLARRLGKEGDAAYTYRFGAEFRDTNQLLAAEWRRTSAFLFVGAAGIAVRHIAPFLEDKTHDPAVLVVDECGKYVIPILSGHIGGGVALAHRVARFLGAQAVITTATDVEKKFAADVFAERNHLLLDDVSMIKKISSVILSGKTVTAHTGIAIEGDPPEGVRPAGGEGAGVTFVCEDQIVGELYPRPYVIGIGCKKGKSADELWEFLKQICGEHGIGMEKIAAIASIDRKKEEEGIWELSRRLGIPYEVYPADELARIPDRVCPSSFVEQTVGVDNVCDRSALCLARAYSGCGEQADARLSTQTGEYNNACDEINAEAHDALYKTVVGKQARDGMTIAVAEYYPKSYQWQ